MRYTSEEFDAGMTDKDMYNAIKAKMTDDERCYLLLDEVQEVENWEKAVNSLLENTNSDIYVTGSNSKLMAGRNFDISDRKIYLNSVYPLSFSEYLDFKASSGKSKKNCLVIISVSAAFRLSLNDFDETSAYQIVEGHI